MTRIVENPPLERSVVGDLGRRIEELASEPDGVFVRKSQGLIGLLPVQLRSEAEEFLEGISPASPKFPELTYIPVIHVKNKRYGGRDTEQQREIRDILLGLKDPVTVVSGETDCKDITQNTLYKSKQKVSARLKAFGLIGDSDRISADGFEEVLAQLADQNKIRALGVNKYGFLCTFSVLLNPDSGFETGLPFETAVELSLRFGLEGKTRYCLSRTAEVVPSGDTSVFIQGLHHRVGIEKWCNRNSVGLTVRAPRVVANEA